MVNNKLHQKTAVLVVLMLLLFGSVSCSSNSDDAAVDLNTLTAVQKNALAKLKDATNLTEEEKKDLSAEVVRHDASQVAEILNRANTYLPLVLKNTVFETIEKKELINGVETPWKKIETLEGDQKTIFKFISNTALRGQFYIDASLIANYKHTYTIDLGDKFNYNRLEQQLITTISSMIFTYKVVQYDHENGEIWLKYTNYNNGKDYPPGIPYPYDGELKERYLQTVHTLKMRVGIVEE